MYPLMNFQNGLNCFEEIDSAFSVLVYTLMKFQNHLNCFEEIASAFE